MFHLFKGDYVGNVRSFRGCQSLFGTDYVHITNRDGFFFIFDSESIQFAAEAWSFFDFGLIRGEKEGLTWGREVV